MEMEELGVSIDQVTKPHLVLAGLQATDAGVFYERLHAIVASERSKPTIWQRISQELLRPEHPFRLHQLMYYSTYKDWDTASQGPPPGWIPAP